MNAQESTDVTSSFGRLNPKSRFRDNLSAAPDLMKKVDTVISDDTLEFFVDSLHRLICHCDPEPGRLTWRLASQFDTEVRVRIIAALAEFETAWNSIRLGNIPASHRQGRVASEHLALAALIAMPIEKLRRLKKRLLMVKLIASNPGKTIAQLSEPVVKKQGRVLQKTNPLLKTNAMFSGFEKMAEAYLGLPKKNLNYLRDYRRVVQHPSSHGTAEGYLYHFQGLEDQVASKQELGMAGNVVADHRYAGHKKAAEELANIASYFPAIFDAEALLLEEQRKRND